MFSCREQKMAKKKKEEEKEEKRFIDSISRSFVRSFSFSFLFARCNEERQREGGAKLTRTSMEQRRNVTSLRPSSLLIVRRWKLKSKQCDTLSPGALLRHEQDEALCQFYRYDVQVFLRILLLIYSDQEKAFIFVVTMRNDRLALPINERITILLSDPDQTD